VLTSGLLRGVLIGAIISLLLLLRRAAHPHVAVLGRIPGTRRYSDIERHTDNEPVPGVFIFRPEGSLLYFNCDHVRDTVLAGVRAADPPPRAIICDLSASPFIDLAGAQMLLRLAEDLRGLGMPLRVVEALASVRDKLRLEQLDRLVESIDRFTSVADAVEELQPQLASAVQPADACD
jgi:MFS superfamily sulfate permease-like transporter